MQNAKFKIKKGDKVKVLLGKDRDKESTVKKVDRKKGKVLVAGVNVYKRYVSGKRRGADLEGGILDITKSLDISNVMLVCPNCKKPTRIGMKKMGNEKISGASLRVRVCRKCGGEIDGGNK